MSDHEETQEVVVAVRYKGQVRWFRSDRDLWILDINRWRDEFIGQGYHVPEFSESHRFGIHCINEESAPMFLGHMSEHELHKDDLGLELANRFPQARSWWDLQDLFPIMFVNFDERSVGAFYPDGTPMERYVPDGWVGEFVDFANEYSEAVFPAKDKFWVRGDSDLLSLLNERGKVGT